MSADMNVKLDPVKHYFIKQVADLTGYSTGYLRNLERQKDIPKAKRDDKEWRYWTAEDVMKILLYKKKHGYPLNK